MAKTIPKTDPNETPLDGTGGKASARAEAVRRADQD